MIDGIVSGKLLLKPKLLQTRRGTPYVIAKMSVYGYQSGNIPACRMNADVIAFDRELCARLLDCGVGEILSLCVIIRPVEVEEITGREIVLRITAKAIIDSYMDSQAKGRGRLFNVAV